MTLPPSRPDRRTQSADAPSGAPIALGYSPAQRLRLTARHIRWLILLAAAWLGFAAFVLSPLLDRSETFGWGLLGTPTIGPEFDNAHISDNTVYFLHAAGYLALFLLTQWLFLLPRRRLALRTSSQGRSRRSAAVGAGFIAMLLTSGAAASLMEVAHVWSNPLDPQSESHVPVVHLKGIHAFWIAMATAWVLWAAVFYWYYRDADHRTAVSRMTRALLAGSILELLVSIPIFARSAPDPDNCYCQRGSYTGLVFGATAIFWLFGPGVYLLLLHDKRRWAARI